MKHCIINFICNEITFLKYRLPFYYKYYSQIIFVDYDIRNNCNSNDGSIEYIKNFNDPENKIILLTDLDQINNIKDYNGFSMVKKQKMSALASKYIKDDINIIWSMDVDEFFNKSLIVKAEEEFNKDDKLISIDCSWKTFIYSHHNLLNDGNRKLGYYPIRITKHFKGKIYGHCNWRTYGKIKSLPNQWIYHFAYIGLKRCYNKLVLYNTKTTSKHLQDGWCKQYRNHLKNNDKYVNLIHPGSKQSTSNYNGPYPEETDIDKMINELNSILP